MLYTPSEIDHNAIVGEGQMHKQYLKRKKFKKGDYFKH